MAGWAAVAFCQFLVAALAVMGSLRLLVRGWRGRTVGTDPHCRRCGYNLSGSSGEHCSECGAPLDERAIVIGVRHRRIPSLLAGLALLLLGFLTASPTAQRGYERIDWYRYYPVGWLLRDFEAGNTGALVELGRRLNSDRPSEGDRDRIVAALVARHRRAPMADLWLLSDTLAGLLVNGKLTEEQRDLYLEGLFKVEVRVPESTRPGERMTVEIRCEANVGSAMSGLSYSQEVGTVTVGGGWSNWWGHPMLGAGLVGTPARRKWQQEFYTPIDAQPGKTVITLQLRQGLYVQPPFTMPDLTAPVWSRVIVVEHAIEVLPPAAPLPVEWVDEAGLEDELTAAFARFFAARTDWLDENRFSIEPRRHKRTRTLPIPVAFDVFLRVAGVEHDAGAWAFDEAGRICAHRDVLLSIPGATEGELILRSNRSLGERTHCRISRMWEGGLNLGTIALPEGDADGR